MASINKLRTRLLNNPENFPDQEIAHYVKNGVISLYELNQVMFLSPMRRRRIEDMSAGRLPSTPAPTSQGNPAGYPQSRQQGARHRFPTAREEDFTVMRSNYNASYAATPAPVGPPPIRHSFPTRRAEVPGIMRGPTPPPLPGNHQMQQRHPYSLPVPPPFPGHRR